MDHDGTDRHILWKQACELKMRGQASILTYQTTSKTQKPFPARGGKLNHLVSSVSAVCWFDGGETPQAPASDIRSGSSFAACTDN